MKPKPAALAAPALALALAAAATACTQAVGDGKAEHRTFSIGDDATTLTIDADDTAVELVPVDREGGEVDVTRWFEAEKWNGDVGTEWSADGDTLHFRTTCSGVVVSCDSRYRVEIPRHLAVEIDGSDGRIEANGFDTRLDITSGDGAVAVADAGGPLNIEARDGSVSIEGAAGPVDLDARDGSVRATDLTAPRVTAALGDGSLHLGFAATPDEVTADSRDGSVTVEVPKGPYRVSTDVRDGSTDVTVPRDPASPHRIKATTADGSVTIRPTG
ncbi:DUF4097 family beta strand repeat-containing protein [Streptomyces sp. WMMC500]|uniref:DUF4097 family beta strand repeat-containing protein n=1 Tax=Streptomyces sp. WMMC500 TaxID=3015154 RepID=UPI00248BC061|nr:DUF4097 family beta strand repeat-containing protein [Streptomyces sp. WMMC500]WBB64238.1 DUF4097 family beta strand repeat-containing protein [Streptomyces sp. WMMC500]